MKTAVERLADAIGYPDRIPNGVSSFAFRVDGGEIDVAERGGRLLFSTLLAADPADFARLASYAPGRMLGEEASLAFDPPSKGLILWQDAPASSPSAVLSETFGKFADSCEWWRERASAAEPAGRTQRPPEEFITP